MLLIGLRMLVLIREGVCCGFYFSDINYRLSQCYVTVHGVLAVLVCRVNEVVQYITTFYSTSMFTEHTSWSTVIYESSLIE